MPRDDEREPDRVDSDIQSLINQAEMLVDQLRELVADMRTTVEEEDSKP